MVTVNRAAAAGLVVSFGEMLIDFVPTESGVSLAEATAFLKAPGGAPANVAIAVTRLGRRSAFVGKLGDDEFGHMLVSVLRDNGVSDAGVVFDSGARSALAFVTLRADGEREFMFYRNPSADMLLTKAELNGISSEISRPMIDPQHYKLSLEFIALEWMLLQGYGVNGAFLSFDPKFDVAITAMEPGHGLWHPNLKLMLVTLGDKGCKYYTEDFQGLIGSFPVKQVDTTGAGDAFVGGMLRGIEEDRSALQDEKKLREVLKFANACGTIIATKKGAISSLPNVSEVMQLLDKA
ncbi:fructokinase-1-like [Curcuma longa]|uniref:fructokinase-1-like n=1 Tax=Curcuma longa TaxID=136217 RepID=UPI003D9FAFF4